MNSHRQIMIAAATAIKNDTAIQAAAIQQFGRGLKIIVGAYPALADELGGIPTEDEAPFLWLYADGTNEIVKSDEGFTMYGVVAACPKSANGDPVISTVVAERTAAANGLVINGGNKIVEEFRDTVMAKIREAGAGAIVSKMTKTESDMSHFPMEWAEFTVEYVAFGGLD